VLVLEPKTLCNPLNDSIWYLYIFQFSYLIGTQSYRAEVRVAGGRSCHLHRHRSRIGLDHRGSGVADGRSSMGITDGRSSVGLNHWSRCRVSDRRSSIWLDHWSGSCIGDGRSSMGVAVVRCRVSIVKKSRSSIGGSQQSGENLVGYEKYYFKLNN